MEREISSMYLFSNFMTNVLTIVSKMTYSKRVMTGRVEEENERNCAGGGGGGYWPYKPTGKKHNVTENNKNQRMLDIDLVLTKIGIANGSKHFNKINLHFSKGFYNLMIPSN